MPDLSLSDRIFDDADTGAIDPFTLFEEWYGKARETEPNDPHAMAVATLDEAGRPDVRMVLMNAHDNRGFVFFTNFDSRKGEELKGHPETALVFHWKSMRRQVRARGPVETVTDAEADAYFASRPKQAQIGAWASKQSAPLESRLAFEKAVAVYAAKYAIGAVPRPPNWSGYRIVPLSIEFWQERPFRLHDRIAFTRDRPGAAWSKTRLYP